MTGRGLGRKEPTDWAHVEKYRLAAIPLSDAISKPTPVVLGINWYRRFDSPQKIDNRYWIARSGDNLLDIRGGHAICSKPGPVLDSLSWCRFYNQGETGRCVGFSESRMMTLLNRVRYDAVWLYNRATETDEWPGQDDPMSGTSVRAGLEILRTEGHKKYSGPGSSEPDPNAGIAAYRWATSVDEIHAVLQSPLADRLGAIPLVNSWGDLAYPHYVWMPDEVTHRLLGESGEAGLVTDR